MSDNTNIPSLNQDKKSNIKFKKFSNEQFGDTDNQNDDNSNSFFIIVIGKYSIVYDILIHTW